MSAADRIQTYGEFWPYYLQEHRKPATRVLHYVGTALFLSVVIWAVAKQTWIVLLLSPICGYFFAWVGHFTVEKNKPATFKYPLWSLISDFRMFFAWLTFQLPRELKKAGVEPSVV